MNSLHIDDFAHDVARIFLILYQRFPRKEILYVDDVCGEDEVDEFGLHSKRYLAAFSTIDWLSTSGYISYSQTIRQEGYEDCVLTHKAFTFLSSLETNREIYPKVYLNDTAISDSDRDRTVVEIDDILTRIDLIHLAAKQSTSEDLKQLILNYFIGSKDY